MIQRHFGVSLLIFLLCAISGCSGTIYPPTSPADPVKVYVTNYGRHSSLVLPESTGGYVEWGYGDWNWFALGHKQSHDAIQPLLLTSQASFSRRVIAPQRSDDELHRTLGCGTLLSLQVSAANSEALMDQLDARYARHGGTQIRGTTNEMTHVKDPERYGLFNNCNHLVARWLRSLGCKVDGLTITSGFELAK